jgi:hypothetical protein
LLGSQPQDSGAYGELSSLVLRHGDWMAGDLQSRSQRNTLPAMCTNQAVLVPRVRFVGMDVETGPFLLFLSKRTWPHGQSSRAGGLDQFTMEQARGMLNEREVSDAHHLHQGEQRRDPTQLRLAPQPVAHPGRALPPGFQTTEQDTRGWHKLSIVPAARRESGGLNKSVRIPSAFSAAMPLAPFLQ